VARGVGYLRRMQMAEGSWYGRWGMNYIYGTWSVLCALNSAGVDHNEPEVRKAVAWLTRIQNDDGGWGEGGDSYKLDYRGYAAAPSARRLVGGAVVGLRSAGESEHRAVAGGNAALLPTQGAVVFGEPPSYPATGSPRVFFLFYFIYSKYFPSETPPF